MLIEVRNQMGWQERDQWANHWRFPHFAFLTLNATVVIGQNNLQYKVWVVWVDAAQVRKESEAGVENSPAH